MAHFRRPSRKAPLHVKTKVLAKLPPPRPNTRQRRAAIAKQVAEQRSASQGVR